MVSRSETTILFEDPFWVAIFEQYQNGYYSVARQVIGATEPHGSEIVMFLQKLNYDRLKFTPPVREEKISKKVLNFKRQLKQIRCAQLYGLKHTYTRAHALIKVNKDAIKAEKQKQSRTVREEEKREKFRLKQEKRKERQRGR